MVAVAVLGLLVVAAPLAPATVAGAGTVGATKEPTGDVEKKIRKNIQGVVGDYGSGDAVVTPVRCPDKVEVRKGKRYTCALTVDDQRVRVVVRITKVGEGGDYKYQFKSDKIFFDMVGVEDYIAQQYQDRYGIDVVAVCGENEVVLVAPPGPYQCAYGYEEPSTGATLEGTVDVTITDDAEIVIEEFGPAS
jgi:hypothetical protein